MPTIKFDRFYKYIYFGIIMITFDFDNYIYNNIIDIEMS